jgi:O-antigen/teichoic acid export membrane protein
LGKIKRLVGETVLYGLGSILPRFLNFLLVRLHTDVFPPEQYGVITNLFAYVAVLNIIFLFGMETAYFRFANKKELNEQKVFNLAQSVVIACSTILSLGLIILAIPVSDLLSIKGHADLVILLIAIMFIDAVVAIPFARLRYLKKPKQFAVGRLINIVILVALNIYLLKFAPFKPDIAYIVVANLIANAFYIFFFLKTLISWRPQYDKEISPQMFSYAYPIMITGLAGMTNEMFSRVTLKLWLPENFYPGKSSDYALGIFGAAYKFAMLMNLAIQAFRYAAEPFFFSNASEKNSPQLFARVNHYFIIVCCVLLLGASINLDILKYFLGDKEYWEGLHIVPVLLLAYLFLGVYYNISVWFKLTDKTYFGTIITLAGAVITVVANYILIPIAGYEGSTWAALLCYFTMTIACYALGQKYYPIPYRVGIGLAYIFGTTLLAYIVNSITISNPVASTAFHFAVMIVYLVVIYLLERKELQQIRA